LIFVLTGWGDVEGPMKVANYLEDFGEFDDGTE